MDKIEEFKKLRELLIEYGYEEKIATEQALSAIFNVYTPVPYVTC